MVCKKCGYQNISGSKYCAECGISLITNEVKQGYRAKYLKEDIKNHRQLWVVLVVFLFAIIALCTAALLKSILPSEAVENNQVLPSEAVENNQVPPSEVVEINQVLPIEDGSVAVLYTDGTVKVSGNDHFSEKASDWSNVTQIYCGPYSETSNGILLVGLTEDGSVLTTESNFPSWNNVDKIRFYCDGVVGITSDGMVLTCGMYETYANSALIDCLTDRSNIKDLVYSSTSDSWGLLTKYGDVYLIDGWTDPYEVQWSNVNELRNSGHGYYVIKNDGTVDGGMDTYTGLAGAVKVVDYQDWIFGISEDGRLLTHNNGNIYPNTGDMWVGAPGSSVYGEEIDITQFNNIEDIYVLWGLILLNQDGTVDTIGAYNRWDLRNWNGIKKISGFSFSDDKWTMISLYGIKEDGSVIISRYNFNTLVQTVQDYYNGWILKDIYAEEGGIIGLTLDGKLVGDGIYSDLDFSVFDR